MNELAPKESGGEFLLYKTEDGQVKLDVRLQDETVWLTQPLMAELFQTTQQNISQHIRNIFEEGELTPEATHKKFLSVRREGKRDVRRALDFAEDQAKRRKQVFMKDWEQKLDEFLRFNDRKILPNAGKVSKQAAEGHAKAEYEQFEIRRRVYKEFVGEAEAIKQLEKAVRESKQWEASQDPSDKEGLE